MVPNDLQKHQLDQTQKTELIVHTKACLKFGMKFWCFWCFWCAQARRALPISEPFFTRARLAPRHEQPLNDSHTTPPYSQLKAEIGHIDL